MDWINTFCIIILFLHLNPLLETFNWKIKLIKEIKQQLKKLFPNFNDAFIWWKGSDIKVLANQILPGKVSDA